jgi:hypothetical protein
LPTTLGTDEEFLRDKINTQFPDVFYNRGGVDKVILPGGPSICTVCISL